MLGWVYMGLPDHMLFDSMLWHFSHRTFVLGSFRLEGNRCLPKWLIWLFNRMIWVSTQKLGGENPQNGWFRMKNPMNKWMILGGFPIFLETPIWSFCCLKQASVFILNPATKTISSWRFCEDLKPLGHRFGRKWILQYGDIQKFSWNEMMCRMEGSLTDIKTYQDGFVLYSLFLQYIKDARWDVASRYSELFFLDPFKNLCRFAAWKTARPSLRLLPHTTAPIGSSNMAAIALEKRIECRVVNRDLKCDATFRLVKYKSLTTNSTMCWCQPTNVSGFAKRQVTPK